MLVIVNVLSTCILGILLHALVVTNRKFWSVPSVVLQWVFALKHVAFVLAEEASAVLGMQEMISESLSSNLYSIKLLAVPSGCSAVNIIRVVWNTLILLMFPETH